MGFVREGASVDLNFLVLRMVGLTVLFPVTDWLRENRARLLYLLKLTVWGLQFNCRDIFRKRNSITMFVSNHSRNITAGSLYDGPCTNVMATGSAPVRLLDEPTSVLMGRYFQID